jgi:hypothetical protein
MRQVGSRKAFLTTALHPVCVFEKPVEKRMKKIQEMMHAVVSAAGQ